jgi:hypothetical protein
MLMEQGWDPQISRFFTRIVNALAWTLIWMIGSATVGFYFGLAFPERFPFWICSIYYAVVAVGLFLLIRYLVRLRSLS